MTLAVAPVLPGETLEGKYKVERVLGQGGMGIVVAARHVALDTRVAIKFLLGEPSEHGVDRFLREARAAVKVHGEHVCRVFDFGRLVTGEPFIVMEYLEGVDLARKLENDGPQPVPEVVGWIIEVCAALAEAHANEIVHRDLKPANVFLSTRPDGTRCAKVLDFGISKLPKGHTITSPAALMGSPAYMAPEQMESASDVDARADVWSLGVMAYELLTGKPPFVATSIVQLTVEVRDKEPSPIETLQPNVPPSLGRVIAKCLAKRPEDRYASVAALVAELAPFGPPELAPLAARVAGRSLPTAPPAPLAVTLVEEKGAGVSPLGGTLSAFQTTLGDEQRPPPPSTPRWPLAVAAAAVVSVVAVVLLRPAPSPVEATAAPPSASAPLPLPSVASAVASAAPIETTPASSTAPPLPAASAVRATIRVEKRTPKVSAPASSASTAIAPPEPAPVRKKRELDREDP